MQGNAGLYAVKKRRKPVQKNVRPPPAKTNPSKRHRDRLNVELDHLTGLLPFSEEVRGRLDKLSVLRLSVGYLKVKSYFHVALPRNTRSAPLVSANGRNGPPVSSLDGVAFSEGELLLQALNGFVLVVTADGTIFYTSPTIRDFLGFHQSDVVHQSVYDLVHMDDRETFKCQLHFALNPSESGADGHSSGKTLSSSQSLLPQHIPPENSSFLERSFCCRLRCLLDNTSGFVALNFSGRLKYLHLGNAGAAAPPQLALFAIATPLQSPSVMEIRTKTLIFQTKHRMDFAPVGIDTRGKVVLGYTEVELVTTGSGYQFIHAADMMYCADNHLRMIKTGDSGFTIFRLLTKTGHWLWVQASARIVFKGGRPDFIIARQKALTNEEGEEHLRQRRQQLPFNLATGEGVLYDVSLDVFSVPGPGPAPGTAEPTAEKPLDPASLLGSLRRQDRSVYALPERPGPQLPVLSQTEDANCEAQPSFERAFLDSHALLSVPSQIQTLQKRSVTGDPTSDAMIDSLEQILGDIGDGGMEGIEVEGTELRDWENTLIRMNKEREDAERELNCTLANEVFSYVEEALRRETGGFVAQGLDQTGCHVPNILSVPGEHQGFSNDEPQWQQTMHKSSDMSGFGEQAQWGNGLSDAGNAMGLKGASRVVSHGTPSALTPTQCCNAHQGHTSSLWPPGGSNRHSGNEAVSTQSCVTHQPWLPSAQGTHSVHSGRRPCSEATHRGVQHSVNQTGSQQTRVGQEPRGPLVWQQQQQQRQQLQQRQQQQQSFHHHRLSHTVGAVNPAARPFHPQTRQFSGSCAYENNEGHTPNAFTVPAGQSGPLPGQAHVLGTAARAPSFAGTGVHQGLASGLGSHAGAHADVGSTGLGRSGDLGALGSGYPAKNTALQSSFFCWNSEAQIPRVSLNGLVDPFAFPARPTGSVNLSHNAGP